MKITKLLSRKKRLRATTVRRQPMLGLPEDSDYDEMSEPNMKLSRALLIVLILHIVAVGGVVAFNSIKTEGGAGPAEPPAAAAATTTNTQPATAPAGETASNVMPVVEASSAHQHSTSKPGSSPADRKTEHAKAGEGVAGGPADSGKIYTVAKGDNPVMIARKLKVPYDDLIALNHIEDPHKLQIGQRLAIPAKPTKPKRTDG